MDLSTFLNSTSSTSAKAASTSATGTSGTSSAAASSTGSTASVNSLNSSDFMTLMLAQLKNQDPTQPTDDTQYIAQMAQLTSVSGIQELNSTLSGMSASMLSSQMLNSSALIGNNVLVTSPVAGLPPSGGVNGQITLPVSAQGVSVLVKDASGATVKTISLGAQAAGPVAFNWDGTNDSGKAMATGNYNLSASYFNGSTNTALPTSVLAQVQSVSLASGAPVLQLYGIGNVSLSSVQAIN